MLRKIVTLARSPEDRKVYWTDFSKRRFIELAATEHGRARAKETLSRMALLMRYPFYAVVPACFIWLVFFYRFELHFNKFAEGLFAAWIAGFDLLYGLVAAKVIDEVFDKHRDLRAAINAYDVNTYMILIITRVSALRHGMMTVFAAANIFSLMLIPYPDVWTGLVVIGTTTYLFSFIYWVIEEADRPLEGVWRIDFVHEEWKNVDPKKWRDKIAAEKRKAYAEFNVPALCSVDAA